MFGLGWPELIIILAIVLLLFGGSRLKGLAKGLGESVREFKNATSGNSEKDNGEKEAIIETARKMGIRTEGKDTTQILKEMDEHVAERKA